MDVGDRLYLHAEFADRYGNPTDPDFVVGYVLKPEESQSEIAVFTRIDVGVYEALYYPDREGKYWWRVEGTGTVTAAEERTFKVKKRRVPSV